MNEIAVVTGGTRGIGRAIVEKLVANDLEVRFTYVHDQTAAQELETMYPGRARATRVDSASPREIEAFTSSLIGERVTVLVNNAGISRDNLFLTSSTTDITDVVAVNLIGTMMFCRHVIPLMTKNKTGSILNVTSRAATHAAIGTGVYGATKAAVQRLTESLALECERFGVSINCLAPSFVDTDMIRRLRINSENERSQARKRPAMVRCPKEVADIAWLILNKSLNVNGKTISI